MRIEKAVAVSLAIHLLLTCGIAISQGIKRSGREPAAEAVFAELVPPPAMQTLGPEMNAGVERIAEKAPSAVSPGKPARTPETVREPSATTTAQPPRAIASTADDGAGPVADNGAIARPEGPDPGQIMRARMQHHLAVVSTDEFYRNVPAELKRFVNEALAGGALMSQGDALIHMDVTPSGQVGQAHVQANSTALLNRLERVEWAETLPPRPMAACNAIHLRISVVGNDIRVDIEML